ncbi:uncharacterized protein DUF2027 [Arcticibacter tournemirensis]|uniref:DUF2027 domain-containing protein n=1 Tax=Arcticibacter tournemirensis TaxID=699437 RepID=A0A5M9H464_9SPHI|nr:DUF2027 domain-containing protein [Arcticibacter tournemirensis]KAA8479954.1 DUF2027 domain-containing protein [Arcticibacter tournemirensis]TQM51583.1 uncharacterized protein DUF2027 [Arcticibacter tournemirensis]
MDYKLGEFVRFVDEKREGYITRIFSDDMIGVTGDDDFEIPVPANKVTRVHGHVYEQQVTDQNAAQNVAPSAAFETKGIYLAVAPDQRKGSVVYFHLVNSTSFQLLITLVTEKGKELKGEFAGIINPASSTRIFTASLSELDMWPTFHLQALYFTTQNIALPEPLKIKEKFKAKDFAGAKKPVPLLKQDAWLIRLDEEDLVIDPVKLKESFFKAPEVKKEIAKPLQEVDLHIEKLRDDHQFLSKTEILKIQLEHFKKSLDAAIVHKLQSIIFIHGAGNGTLRMEIHKSVGRNPHVKTFMDARKEKFGYGATEVILK